MSTKYTLDVDLTNQMFMISSSTVYITVIICNDIVYAAFFGSEIAFPVKAYNKITSPMASKAIA